MYNRYIPQGDGTYQRRRVQEIGDAKKPPAPPPDRDDRPGPMPSVPRPEPPESPPPQAKPPRPDKPPESPVSAMGFLEKLMPKNMDTGDLLVLLILLLLLQDGNEDATPALLTLALFFML